MSKIKKVLSNVWVIGVFSPIIGTIIISAFTALIKQINFFVALKLILMWIVKVITFRIPLYIIIIVILSLFFAIKVYVKIQDSKESNLPKWLKYTKIQYKNWFMAWEYELNYDNKYKIESVRPICKCGCELSFKESYKNAFYGNGVLVCPKCESTYPPLERSSLEDFYKILIHDINVGNYPQDL